MEGNSTHIHWSDLRVPVSTSDSSTALIGQVGQDSRKWNHLHYTLCNPQCIQEHGEKYCCHNDKSIDTPGPGGLTPLMLAVTQHQSTGSFIDMLAVTQSHTTGTCEHCGLPCQNSSQSSMSIRELTPRISTEVRLVSYSKILHGSFTGSCHSHPECGISQ